MLLLATSAIVRAVLEGTARYRFGYHLLVGLRPGSRLSDDDKRMLENLGPAGVILSGANFSRDGEYEDWLSVHEQLIADIRTYSPRPDVLICIDHEGHGIVRPPEPITAYAHARAWAGQAREVATAMGVELASLGINVSFGPVIDIDVNPQSPVIGHRAFGTDSFTVAESGRIFVQGLESQGVLACPKHYPGHGAAAEDSHTTLPTLSIGLDDLRQRELVPFAEVVRKKVRMIMSAHLLFPSIDPKPATYSHILLKELLRDELGFGGVLVTDDIGMPAVRERFTRHDDALAAALTAGTDLIMICDYWTDTDRAYDIAEDIERRLSRGHITEETLLASHARIERLLLDAPRNAVTRLPADLLESHEHLAPLGRRSSSALSEAQTVRLARERT